MSKEAAEALTFLLDAGKKESYPRAYLGMSQLGHSCPRYLWFYFHWADIIKTKWQIERIFAAGNSTEQIVLDELRRLNIEVSGQQDTLTHAHGAIRGHIDAILRGVPDAEDKIFLCEVKSMKEQKWKAVQKNGVKAANKAHWCQCQVYMHKLGLEDALYIVLNKNTSLIYVEHIPYDKNAAEALLKRGTDIIRMACPPQGIAEDPSYYECNWCDFKEVCHERKNLLKSCRSCKYGIPYNSVWYCTKKAKELLVPDQKAACDKYDMLKV